MQIDTTRTYAEIAVEAWRFDEKTSALIRPHLPNAKDTTDAFKKALIPGIEMCGRTEGRRLARESLTMPGMCVLYDREKAYARALFDYEDVMVAQDIFCENARPRVHELAKHGVDAIRHAVFEAARLLAERVAESATKLCEGSGHLGPVGVWHVAETPVVRIGEMYDDRFAALDAMTDRIFVPFACYYFVAPLRGPK